MNDEILKILDEEIKTEIKNLSTLTPGSEEHTAAIDSAAKLYRLKIENYEADTERDKLENEDKFRNAQLSEQKKERLVKVGIAAAELIIPLVAYGIWMRKGFEFEETGSYTSTTFKGLFKHFRPKK